MHFQEAQLCQIVLLPFGKESNLQEMNLPFSEDLRMQKKKKKKKKKKKLKNKK